MAKRLLRRNLNRYRPRNKPILFIKPNKLISSEPTKQFSKEITLSETDKIKYVYSRSSQGEISEIISVSYNIYISDEWVTVVYYDSVHGYLHRHEIISFSNSNDTVTTDQVKKKGNKQIWLTWAIDDIKLRHNYYREEFLKRSELIDKE